MIGGIGGIDTSYLNEISTGFGETSSNNGQRQRSQDTAVARKPKPNTDETGLTLSPEKQKVIQELQARDREVRAHESAHMAAGAGLTSGVQYSLTKGPDNRHYAVGGSVSIDTSVTSGDPEATVSKARQIKAAALAPASPSTQDLQVASKGAQLESQALRDKAIKNYKNEDSYDLYAKGDLLSAVA